MKVLPLACILFLSSCAAVMTGSRQNLTVVTPDVDGASCTLTDSKGRSWSVASTPGTAIVKKGDAPISVICKKEGYTTGTAEVHTTLTQSNYGNLALGPAAPIGYFLDGITGSAQKYESTVEVDMEPTQKGGMGSFE